MEWCSVWIGVFVTPRTGRRFTRRELMAMSAIRGADGIRQRLRCRAAPVGNSTADLDGLAELVGDAEVVVLGTPSQGMREANDLRFELSRRLIAGRGFHAVAMDADWMEGRRLDRLARGGSGWLECSGFPAWEWDHPGMREFMDRLAETNRRRDDGGVGVYGLDLFGLRRAMNGIVRMLGGIDPALAARAVRLYGGIDRFGRDPQNYGLLAGVEDDVRRLLVDRLAECWACDADPVHEADAGGVDGGFIRKWNARMGEEAWPYFRAMFRSYTSSWNHRCLAMMRMLESLAAHLRETRGAARIIVWAHNSLAGDARATELSWRGETSLGALARERFGDRCRLVGCTSHAGKVTAAAEWMGRPVSQKVPAAPEGSCERLFHRLGMPAFWLDLSREDEVAEILAKPLLQRGIGAVYRPAHGTRVNWFSACCALQFDAVVHLDSASPVLAKAAGPGAGPGISTAARRHGAPRRRVVAG
jgi:erythromycin esterase-like protein